MAYPESRAALTAHVHAGQGTACKASSLSLATPGVRLGVHSPFCKKDEGAHLGGCGEVGGRGLTGPRVPCMEPRLLSHLETNQLSTSSPKVRGRPVENGNHAFMENVT